MFTASYLEMFEDGSDVARAREAELFDILISRLEAVQEAPSDDLERLACLRRIQEVWRFLVSDLANPGNSLPDELKGDLISIGLWSIRKADALIAGEANDMEPLIEIQRSVRNGLSPDGLA